MSAAARKVTVTDKGQEALSRPARKPKDEPKPTEYLVLERIEAPVPGVKGNPTRKAWIEIGRATIKGTKAKAIEEVVGDRSGAFKAVASSAWKGGVERGQRSIFENRPLAD
jgi:hypothetical protein